MTARNGEVTRRVTEAVTLPRPDPTRPDPKDSYGYDRIRSNGELGRFGFGQTR